MTLCWIFIFLTIPFLKAEEEPIEMYAQVGGTVVLPRDTHGGILDDSRKQTKNVYVNWFRGSEGGSLINRNPQSGIQLGSDKKRFSMLPDFSLQISPVEESDFEVFRCEQYLITDVYKKIYRLRRVTVTKVQAVMVGDPLSLKCDLEASRFSRSARINWIQPKSPQCNQIVPRSSGHVSVPNMPICASGVWTCSVKYNQMELKATTTVYVIDLSPAPSDSIYTSVSDSPVNVPCSLSSDIPWNLLNETDLQGGSWTFSPLGNEKQQETRNILHLNLNHSYKWAVTNGGGIPVQGRELKDKDLSILKLPVSANISGEYTCTLNFKSRTFSRKVKVEVLYVSSTGGSRLFEGQMVNLSCSLSSVTDNVTPEVKWICPSCSTHPLLRSSPHPAFLSMHVRMEDKGRWKCELRKNQTILTYAEISLRIEKVPVDIWLCVAIGSGVVVFILLLVIIIIAIRRHKQMLMYRRRKTRFCCCKTPQPKGFYKS